MDITGAPMDFKIKQEETLYEDCPMHFKEEELILDDGGPMFIKEEEDELILDDDGPMHFKAEQEEITDNIHQRLRGWPLGYITQHIGEFCTPKMSSLSLSSPTRSGKDYNGLETTDSPTSLGNGFNKDSGSSEAGDALGKLLETIENSSGAERKAAFEQLALLIRESDPITLNTHFRKILKCVLGKSGLLGDADCRLGGLTALSEVMKRKCLWSSLQTYLELILLRVIDAYSDGNKEVSKLAEQAALLIISAIDPADVIRVLIPLMRAEEFPKNLMAIKTLTKLVEMETKEAILPFLPDIMPGLVQAYANEESLVRKSTVFCMVALHNKLGGDTLKPYLASLNASKLKLLHLYINRTQTEQQQAANSPKSASAV